MKNVFNALLWLKENNHEYHKIILPFDSDNLLDKLLETEVVFVNENNTERDEDDENNNKVNDHSDSEKNTDNYQFIDNAIAKIKSAMLTQKEKTDEFYEQYTIYPINENRVNGTSTYFYQMKIFLMTID